VAVGQLHPAQGRAEPRRGAGLAEGAASKEGQDAFNPKKGSIPARKDADTSLYTDYLADALKDWGSDKLAGSIQHGVTVNDAWRVSINEAVGLFHTDKDVAALQAALAEAAKNSGQ
jgi:glucose/mannose transport system substrate-binding protein